MIENEARGILLLFVGTSQPIHNLFDRPSDALTHSLTAFLLKHNKQSFPSLRLRLAIARYCCGRPLPVCWSGCLWRRSNRVCATPRPSSASGFLRAAALARTRWPPLPMHWVLYITNALILRTVCVHTHTFNASSVCVHTHTFNTEYCMCAHTRL